MARPRGRRVVVEMPEEEEEEDEEVAPGPGVMDVVRVHNAQQALPTDEDVERIVSEVLAGGNEYRVWLQQRDKTGEYVYIDTLPADLFSMEHIKQAYGPGRYRGKVIDARGVIKKHLPPWGIGGAAVTPLPNPQDKPSDLDSVVERVVARLTPLLMRSAAPADPMGEMVKMAQGLGAIATALRPTSSGSPVGEMIAVFREGLSLGREAGGGEGDEDGFKSMVRTVSPLIGAAAQKLAEPKALPAPAPAPPLTSAPQPVTASPVQPSAVPAWLMRLKAYVPVLVQMARVPVPPEDVADTLATALARMPEEEMIDTLDALGDGPTALDAIVRNVPGLQPHRDWLEVVRQGVLNRFPEEEEAEAPTQAGDAGSANEGAGTVN